MNEALTASHHLDHEKHYAELIPDLNFMEFTGFISNDNYPILSKFKKYYEPVILDALREIQQTVSRWKMLDEPMVEQNGEWVMMTIGNVWRLARRGNDQDLSFWEYCITARRWQMISREDYIGQTIHLWFEKPDWPVIKCIEWKKYERTPYEEQILAIIYYAACKLSLAKRIRSDEISGRVWKLKQLQEGCAELFRHYREWAKESKRNFYAMRKALWRHFLDRSLMSALCTKNYGMTIRLNAYIKAIDQAEHLSRLARESRNFLPMLNIIPANMWPRDDLLKDDTLRECPALAGFSNSALRWLRQAPCGVLCKLHYHKALPQTVEVLSGLNLGRKIPVIVQRRIIQRCWALEGFEKVPVEVIRLFRLFAGHCLEIRDKKGWKAMKRFVLQRRILHSVLDWFWSDGLERGLPDKNSTWASLVRHSDYWHGQFGHGGINVSLVPLVTWDSPLPETTIDDIVIRPLNSNHALIEEGQVMRHCASSYVPQCRFKGYRVFSLTAPDGTRSTLGIMPDHHGWQLDQHYGKRNSPVSPAAAQAAIKLLYLATKASFFNCIRRQQGKP